ncbi:glycoside hydrolase family 5 protein [Athelia psychrophila]|uniref:Glycoside hydrolase family 5 protein n=1 Tax=Athelia psychrophila TaxID=1759441 RepID=A0A166NQL9_9AGAM|nr:glycoside hydrolase family 5 protein [Fibularhizoctonia sp. CBS 109695]
MLVPTHSFALLGLSLIPSVISCFSPGFSPGFPYGSEKVRGVNLGGWLVLEPWITPSLFDSTGNNAIVDEWTFGEMQSKTTATNALQNHWNTWITESDFEAIAAAGLNHVRVPIGYWAFEVGPGEPYISGQLPYLQKAVTWAGNHGLKVIVDLHGAPGSQNGFDNSGETLVIPMWHSNATNVERTDAILKTIASMFKDQTSVVPIIAALNEPLPFDPTVIPVITQYWNDAYSIIRYPYGTSEMGNAVSLIHTAFYPLSYWVGFQTAVDGFQGVAMDTHIYQMFTDAEVAFTYQQHIAAACNQSTELSSFDKWIIVGEWTAAATDCATYANGRGVGSRYDGTYPGSTKVGSCTGLTGKSSTFSSSYKTFLGQYWQAQVEAYEAGQGWIQWTWKAENADEWTYQAGLAGGWIPPNPANHKYPSQC